MKTFYIDEQITIWRRCTYEATSIKEMKKMFQDNNEDTFVEAELLLDTAGGIIKRELLTEDLKKLISQKC